MSVGEQVGGREFRSTYLSSAFNKASFTFLDSEEPISGKKELCHEFVGPAIVEPDFDNTSEFRLTPLIVSFIGPDLLNIYAIWLPAVTQHPQFRVSHAD